MCVCRVQYSHNHCGSAPVSHRMKWQLSKVCKKINFFFPLYGKDTIRLHPFPKQKQQNKKRVKNKPLKRPDLAISYLTPCRVSEGWKTTTAISPWAVDYHLCWNKSILPLWRQWDLRASGGDPPTRRPAEPLILFRRGDKVATLSLRGLTRRSVIEADSETMQTTSKRLLGKFSCKLGVTNILSLWEHTSTNISTWHFQCIRGRAWWLKDSVPKCITLLFKADKLANKKDLKEIIRWMLLLGAAQWTGSWCNHMLLH